MSSTTLLARKLRLHLSLVNKMVYTWFFDGVYVKPSGVLLVSCTTQLSHRFLYRDFGGAYCLYSFFLAIFLSQTLFRLLIRDRTVFKTFPPPVAWNTGLKQEGTSVSSYFLFIPCSSVPELLLISPGLILRWPGSFSMIVGLPLVNVFGLFWNNFPWLRPFFFL